MNVEIGILLLLFALLALKESFNTKWGLENRSSLGFKIAFLTLFPYALSRYILHDMTSYILINTLDPNFEMMFFPYLECFYFMIIPACSLFLWDQKHAIINMPNQFIKIDSKKD